MTRWLIVTACVWMCYAGAALAQTCTTYPNTLTNGTNADATQVMANFNCAALKGNGLFTGNVGIGTTTPSVPLSLGNSSVASIKFALYDNGASDLFGVGALNNNLTFGAGISASTAAQMVLSGGGDVGIGTTTPTQRLVVNGNTDVMANSAYLTEIPNASSTGTTANKLAKLTGAPSTAVIAATTDTDGMIGVVVGNAGTTGSAQIAVGGQAACVFENATTAGDFVVIGSTTAGDCHDAGATRPTTGQTLGRVLATVTAGSSAEVLLYIR